MSGFTSINLSALPAPDVIQTVDFEALLEEMKAAFVAVVPELASAIELESELTNKMLQAFAYWRMLDRQEFNDNAIGLLIAKSTGSTLDHLAADFGVERLVIQEANDTINPPIPEIMESDKALRQRVQLSHEGRTTAGSRGGYIFHALSASGRIKDVSVNAPHFGLVTLDPALQAQLPANVLVYEVLDDAGLSNPLPGDVAVTALVSDGDGTPTPDDLTTIQQAVNDEEIRPLTDHPRISGASIINYQVEAVLTIMEGPDASIVLAAAQEAVEAYVADRHKLDHDITLSGLNAALFQAGVQKVELIQPAADIIVNKQQAAYCSDTPIVTIGGVDV